MASTRRPPSPLAAGADAALSLGEGDVQKLIQQLPPSDDLLEYYRAKTDQFQSRLDGLTDTLDRWVAFGGMWLAGCVINRSARCPRDFIVLVICENHVTFLISLEFKPSSGAWRKDLN